MTYTGCGKTSRPNFVRWKGGTKQRFIVRELYVGNASLQRYGPSNWVWLSFYIKQKHWSILRRSSISYKFRADIQTYGHRPRDTDDKDAAEIDVCAQKCQATVASTIWAIIRINISPQHTTIAELEGAGQWLGLPVRRTSRQWTSSYGATLKPWFTRCQLILKRILLVEADLFLTSGPCISIFGKIFIIGVL